MLEDAYSILRHDWSPGRPHVTLLTSLLGTSFQRSSSFPTHTLPDHSMHRFFHIRVLKKITSFNLQDGQALALPAGTDGAPRPALQVWHREPNSGAWTRFSERASRFLLQSAGSGARECILEEDNGRQVPACQLVRLEAQQSIRHWFCIMDDTDDFNGHEE
jgi:hypothetical protein